MWLWLRKSIYLIRLPQQKSTQLCLRLQLNELKLFFFLLHVNFKFIYLQKSILITSSSDLKWTHHCNFFYILFVITILQPPRRSYSSLLHYLYFTRGFIWKYTCTQQYHVDTRTERHSKTLALPLQSRCYIIESVKTFRSEVKTCTPPSNGWNIANTA